MQKPPNGLRDERGTIVGDVVDLLRQLIGKTDMNAHGITIREKRIARQLTSLPGMFAAPIQLLSLRSFSYHTDPALCWLVKQRNVNIACRREQPLMFFRSHVGQFQ